MAVKFAAWGGADSIGASCYTIKFDSVLCMVDYGYTYRQNGMFKKPSYEGPPPKYLFLTHAHTDHVGGVIEAMNRWPDMVVLATRQTIALLTSVWAEMAFVAQQLGHPEPFQTPDIHRAVRRMHEIRPGEKVWLGDNLTVHAVWAGHVLGAVSFVFGYRNTGYVFTGDVSYQEGFFFEQAHTFSVSGPCALLVQDSTYLGQPITDSVSEKERFVQGVQDVLSNEGQVLIPALATGRIQEVIATLVAGGIDPSVIFLDGALKRTRLFHWMAPTPDSQTLLRYQTFRDNDHRRGFVDRGTPVVVVATSGMVSKGSPSFRWAQHFLSAPKAAFFFVNWRDPCSPAGYIWEQKNEADIFLEGRESGVTIPRRATIDSFSCFSGHPDDHEVQALEEALSPETVVYVHGRGEAMDAHIATQGQIGVSRFRGREGVVLTL